MSIVKSLVSHCAQPFFVPRIVVIDFVRFVSRYSDFLDAEASTLESAKNLSAKMARIGVRLDEHKRAFESHLPTTVENGATD